MFKAIWWWIRFSNPVTFIPIAERIRSQWPRKVEIFSELFPRLLLNLPLGIDDEGSNLSTCCGNLAVLGTLFNQLNFSIRVVFFDHVVYRNSAVGVNIPRSFYVLCFTEENLWWQWAIMEAILLRAQRASWAGTLCPRKFTWFDESETRLPLSLSSCRFRPAVRIMNCFRLRAHFNSETTEIRVTKFEEHSVRHRMPR